MRLVDMDTSLADVLRRIEPNLHDLNVTINETTKTFEVDFYFKDDPRKDEEGYLGCGFEEFIPQTPTWHKLNTILWVLKYCLNLNWDDE